ncbi:CAP domain-containing protein [Konateibacter massiliensis]|uniref:CAP domain-containing protein n=1 Tax=Konateibacter massiliensis TaxID=2002841 RepID=UPI001F313C51|nr:CAP domain-containing protein [Konateibacter massiliensis]
MKKVTTLGVVALTMAVNLIPMKTEAAGLYSYSQCSRGQNAVTINGNCSLEDLQSQLKSAGVNADCNSLSDAVKSVQEQLNGQNCNQLAQIVIKNSNGTTTVDTSTGQTSTPSTGSQNGTNCPNNSVTTPTETTTPETTTPSDTTTTPETTVPETTTPSETTTPETTTPETTTPETTAPTETTDSSTTENTTSNASYAQQVVDLVNVERAKEGLNPLTNNALIAKAATVRASEIQTKFEHVRPDGSGFVTALKEQGITYRGAGENIAWGQKTPQEVVTAWMNSPGHRANIMNPNYVNIGVGNLQNSAGTQYWVQIFTY